MACPPPRERDILAAESAERARQKQVIIDRVAKLHRAGESNTTISRRLGISIPTVVKYLREAGESGHSARESEGVPLPRPVPRPPYAPSVRGRPARHAQPSVAPQAAGPAVWTQLPLLEVAPSPRPARPVVAAGCRTARRARPQYQRLRATQLPFAFAATLPVRETPRRHGSTPQHHLESVTEGRA